MPTIYGAMGVDAHKGDVEDAFCGRINNKFPGAWVNIVPDPRLSGYVKTLKVDGDGSKPTQHCLDFLETGDETVFASSADDTHAMPIIDAAAAGFVDEIDFVDVLDLNKLAISGLKANLMQAYSRRISWLIHLHRKFGIDENFLGGETADLPSQVSTYVCNGIVWARTQKENVVRGNIEVGDVIWGIPSDGTAIWEDRTNSGIMCNGITLAAAVLMWDGYNKKYPFLRHEKQKYRGQYRVDDRPSFLDGMTVSEAIRSGTRQWAIFLKMLYDELRSMNAFHLLHGVSVNTGGGTTKCLRLGQNIRYVKLIPAFPPIFQAIMEEGGVPWQEMLSDFNCGIGVEIIGSPEGGLLAKAIENVCRMTNLKSFRIGFCDSSENIKNEVVITTDYGEMTYSPE